MVWARMLAYITGTVDQELLVRNEYLAAENCIGVSLSRSAVEGVFLDPVEASVDEQERFAVNELKLHVDLVAVHVSIERQLTLGHALERKVCFPALVIVLCEF